MVKRRNICGAGAKKWPEANDMHEPGAGSGWLVDWHTTNDMRTGLMLEPKRMKIKQRRGRFAGPVQMVPGLKTRLSRSGHARALVRNIGRSVLRVGSSEIYI